MNPTADNREATAAIRGYIYQFDATISSILDLDDTGELTVEGIEDFDIECGNLCDYFQCKYYAASRLTPATIRDAILPMLQRFLSLDEPSRKRRRYHLYGYFKDSSPGDTTLTAAELKRSLVRRERRKLPSGKMKTILINVQTEIGATESDIKLFSRHLTVHVCDEYEQHKKEVVEALKKAFCVSQFEAEGYLYPSALTLVSRLAVAATRSARKINRAAFVNRLRPSRALFNTWALREKGQDVFCRTIRRKHFSVTNIDAVHRLFVIETPAEATNAELLAFIHSLRSKWSSHRVRRKPDAERYAPYIYFRSLSDDRLVALKATLHQEGVSFVDGYAFLGASFSPGHLRSPQSYENQISLRFINSASDLSESLQQLRGARSVYEFFVDSPITNNITCQHVIIPITSISMISQMI